MIQGGTILPFEVVSYFIAVHPMGTLSCSEKVEYIRS